jgi:hypothetical protein
LISQFEKENLFATFTKHRARFEDFLLKYKHFSDQVTGKWGSGIKAFDKFHDLLRLILDHMIAGDSDDLILVSLASDKTFMFLKAAADNPLDEEIGKDFNKDTMSKAFLTVALKSAVRCAYCNGYLDKKFSVDHKIPKKEGAKATSPMSN